MTIRKIENSQTITYITWIWIMRARGKSISQLGKIYGWGCGKSWLMISEHVAKFWLLLLHVYFLSFFFSLVSVCHDWSISHRHLLILSPADVATCQRCASWYARPPVPKRVVYPLERDARDRRRWLGSRHGSFNHRCSGTYTRDLKEGERFLKVKWRRRRTRAW